MRFLARRAAAWLKGRQRSSAGEGEEGDAAVAAPRLPPPPGQYSSLPAHILATLQAGTLNYHYKGVPTLKCPLDLALYSKLIWEVKPRTIIEIGSNAGGSALWLADQLRSFGIDGHVWSYDLNRVKTQRDERVTFLRADAAALAATITLDHLDALPRPFLVIEDSSHQRADTMAVLTFFADILEAEDYMIVEDGIVTDLGLAEMFDGGPADAIAEFLAVHPEWSIDRDYCDFFGPNMTWNVNGYLRKKRTPDPV